MGISDNTLQDEMTALFDASCLIAKVCGGLTNREGIQWMVRIHTHIRQRHQELRYLDSFERDVAIERIKLEYE